MRASPTIPQRLAWTDVESHAVIQQQARLSLALLGAATCVGAPGFMLSSMVEAARVVPDVTPPEAQQEQNDSVLSRKTSAGDCSGSFCGSGCVAFDGHGVEEMLQNVAAFSNERGAKKTEDTVHTLSQKPVWRDEDTVKCAVEKHCFSPRGLWPLEANFFNYSLEM